MSIGTNRAADAHLIKALTSADCFADYGSVSVTAVVLGWTAAQDWCRRIRVTRYGSGRGWRVPFF